MSDQPSSAEPRPTVFKERYELHRRLARGGMSDVFLARDLLLDRPVAVKVLFPEYAKDPTFVERFRREAQAAARLTHGNIVAIYDWGEELGTYFIAMEYVDGRPLSEAIRAEGPFDAQRAATMTAEVAAALGFAHRNGVVHRDVKPGNVLLSGTGQVKVADFGIAQAAVGGERVNLTQTGAVMGTATYFSPEQAQGKPVDARSDLYSLGCVLYEMLATRPPFTGDSPVAIAYKHVQEQPPTLSAIGVRVPPALEAIIMKLLHKDPSLRYASADDLRADLRRFLDGQPVLAASDPINPAAAALGGAVAGAALAGGAEPAGASGAPTMAIPASGGVPAPSPTGPTGPPADTGYGGYGGYDYDEPPRRSGWLVAFLILLLAILAGVLFIVGSNLSESTTEQLEVPTVERLPVDDAVRDLESRGFEVERIDEANDQTPKDIVFDQDPDGGTMADKGSKVTIKVSTGVDQVEVPKVIGFNEVQALSLLENEGFRGEVEAVFDPDVPEGEVVSQDPEPGTLADKGSVVTLVVSKGEEQESVPDVRGLSEIAATNELERKGFEVDIAYDFDDSVAKGQVIRTQPEAGEDVEPGATVTIVISNGPEPTTTTTEATTTTSSSSTTTSSTSTSSSTSSTSTTSTTAPESTTSSSTP